MLMRSVYTVWSIGEPVSDHRHLVDALEAAGRSGDVIESSRGIGLSSAATRALRDAWVELDRPVLVDPVEWMDLPNQGGDGRWITRGTRMRLAAVLDDLEAFIDGVD